MPVQFHVPIRRLSQAEFGEIAFAVMQHVFAMHHEIGRFLDEKIYKRELAHRMPGVRLEEPIDIAFGSYQTRLFIDVLLGEGAIFEFKAVTALAPVHRAQLLQYLLLAGVAHGKLINVRTESVEHQFVNAHLELADRIRFSVQTDRLNTSLPGVAQLREFLIACLRDLGTGLGIGLYEDAVVHCFGGKMQVEAEVKVQMDGRHLGYQRVRLIAPGVALKITAFDGPLEPFEIQARRLLTHLDVIAIAWVNINMKQVTFTTLER